MSALPEIYFDDSGNTGDDLDNDAQRNLFIAGVLISPDAAEALTHATDALWTQAADACSLSGVEWKGEQLYGGKGPFRGVPGGTRKQLLGGLVDLLLDHEVPILWQGLPKWQAKARGLDEAVWKKVLFGYCSLLHDYLETEEMGRTLVIGDENTSVRAWHQWVAPPQKPWPLFEDGAVKFMPSDKVRGLQIADVVAHTLYRANKAECPDPERGTPRLSNTDVSAVEYRDRLAAGGNCRTLLDPVP